MVFVLIVGDAGVGGGGLGVDVDWIGFASGGADLVVSSLYDANVELAMGFVRIVGSCASGEMVSLSREDCRAEAETDVEVMLARSVCGGGLGG